METQQPTTLNLRDASRISGIGVATLRRMCQENRLKHARLVNGNSGRNTYLIYADALEAILTPYESKETQPKPKRQVGRPQTVRI